MSDKPVVGKVSFGPKVNTPLNERIKVNKAVQDPDYFYKMSLGRGVDYNFYGDWQKQYAKMIFNICEIIKRTGKAKPYMIDVGCACGVNTRGFRDLGVFGSVKGCDPSEFMINLGRKTHGFNDEDLFVSSADKLVGMKSNSMDFIHCANVLEHCEESDIRPIFNEFKRVVQPDGLIFITVPTITEKHSEEEIKKNENHLTVKPFRWWEDAIDKIFEVQPEIYEKFKYDKHSPDNSKKTFYDYYNAEWTIFLLTRR
jgi:ubiquinone/menaquinone biosynthesis C-methylase UbiE